MEEENRKTPEGVFDNSEIIFNAIVEPLETYILRWNGITVEDLLNVVNNGTYYDPAYLHYGKVCNVYCVRCDENIDRSYGLDISEKKVDLCLNCVKLVKEGIH